MTPSAASVAQLRPDPAPSAGAGPAVPGWVRITSHALVRTTRAVAAEALRSPFRDTRVRISDDGSGALAVEVTAPLALPALGSGVALDEPVVASAHRARQVVADRVRELTGRQVHRVSVVFASSVVSGSSAVDVPRRIR